MQLEQVHIVDDDAEVRKSLAFLLRASGLAVAIYESGEALLHAVSTGKIKAGCVITDVRMPRMNGLELQRRLKSAGVTLPIIVITGHGDVPLAVEALKAGAADFIEKPFQRETILKAVQSALESDRSQTRLQLERDKIAQRIASLTARELLVLREIVDGKPNKVIARELDISPRTIEVYRANMMTKMQASSLSEVIRMALVVGVLSARPN